MTMKMIGKATQNPNTENFVRANVSSIAEHLEANPNAATRFHRTTYKCKDCDKEYDSFQALGGHRASHRKLNTETEVRGPQSLEETPSKMHECKICKKGFAIGQALGGHMRKHREIKIDGDKDLLHKNKEMVNENYIWNTTVVSSLLQYCSSSVTSCNSNGKEVFKYDLNLLPRENELINIYLGSIRKQKSFS
ncbi:hypothetical protein L6452_01650 [Arctium lappa]|uniref:Uncharacterized protein n=1 Tax=Arctium lappa TaxID=4217 RepID=A0ACB9FGP5_ARCLA|nr:hypothetical protein L6452_01650 [Arctium lappa]